MDVTCSNGCQQIFVFVLTIFHGLYISPTYCFYNKDVCEDIEDIRKNILSKHLINMTLYYHSPYNCSSLVYLNKDMILDINLLFSPTLEFNAKRQDNFSVQLVQSGPQCNKLTYENQLDYIHIYISGRNIYRGNYTSFNLSTVTRSWAIALGIRMQPMVKPYRRSRAGRNLFRKIHVIASTTHKYSVPEREVNTSNIRKIEYIPDRFKLNLSHINARSLALKSTDFQQYLIQHDINISTVPKTLLKEDIEPETLWEIVPQGYKIYSAPHRTGKQGGDLALVCEQKLKMDMVNINANITTMELVIYNSKIAMHSIILVLLYCPPPIQACYISAMNYQMY